jgi:hypothetical protein
MYSHHRYLFIADEQSTPVLSFAPDTVVSNAMPDKVSKLRGALSGILAALPFVVSLLMIFGFGCAVYPLIVHGLPVFISQSPLG